MVSFFGVKGVDTAETLKRALSAELCPSKIARHMATESRGGSHNTRIQKHADIKNICVFLVEGGGFEPPKSPTADLQSAPFGRSGTLPYIKFNRGYDWSW